MESKLINKLWSKRAHAFELPIYYPLYEENYPFKVETTDFSDRLHQAHARFFIRQSLVFSVAFRAITRAALISVWVLVQGRDTSILFSLGLPLA